MRKILRTLALVIALLAALALSVSAAGICGHHAAHDAACGYQAAAVEVPCDLACTDTDADGIIDHAAECAYTPAQAEVPCGYECQVCATQALIDALPDTVTGKNAATVEAQITAIDTAKAALSAADAALLDMSKYEVAAAGLTVQKARPQGNDITVTTEEELLAAVAEANLRAAELAEGEKMAQMTIRLANNIDLTKTVPNADNTPFMIGLNKGANVLLTSTAGNRYTLKPSDDFHSISKDFAVYLIQTTGKLKLADIILDCNSCAPHFGVSAIYALDHADVTICDGTVVTGFGGGTIPASAINVTDGSRLVMEGGEVCYNDTTKNTSSSFQTIGTIFVFEGTFVMNGGRIHHNTIRDHWIYYYFGGGGIIGAMGGTIYPTEVVINGGIIEDNLHIGGYGGAINGVNGFVDGKLSITVTGGKFRNNQADYGGAIATRGANSDIIAYLTVTGGEFTGNSAYGGGAIYSENYSDVTINDGLFSGNKAYNLEKTDDYWGEGGGAITIKTGSTGRITGGKITGNYAELTGGAIQLFVMSELTITGGEISGNEAQGHAGAICVADAFSANIQTRSILRLKGGSIKNNLSNSVWSDAEHQSDPFAPGGGAIYLHSNCELYVDDGAEISGNKVLGYGSGGGVYCCFGGYIEMNGGILSGNTSANHGGGVYVDGTSSYEGEVHENNNTGDDTYGTGAVMLLKDGRISGNTAAKNGGGIYISGKTTAMVKGENNTVTEEIFRGGLVRMNGGVITANRADDQGGGVYLQSGDKGDYGATFLMTDGALYRNIAGENGNGSTGAKDAGAELFAEGDIGAKTTFTVIPAKDITAYIRDTSHTYIPEADRTLVYTNWYDDYSDLDPTFGKGDPATWETGRNTGRYTTSKVLDRIVYTPEREDGDYEALILDTETQLTLKKTVSGENIQIESHVFTVTLGSGENNPMAGTRLPVVILGNVRSEDVVEGEDGKLYIVFDATGTATFILDADDKLAIDRIPSGTEFRIVETDLGAAVGIDASVENAKGPAFDESSRVVTGSTEVKVDGETFVTQSDVIVDNHYTKPADDPADDPEDDPKDDPTDDPKDDPKDDPTDDPKDDPEADKPSGDSGNKKPDSDVPDTGDNMMLWLALCLVSLLALALPLKKLTK